MLISEFQGVVCVDGLVLEGSEFHFGNELKIKLGDEAEESDVEPEPFLYEPQKRFASPRVSVMPVVDAPMATAVPVPTWMVRLLPVNAVPSILKLWKPGTFLML